MSRYAKHFLPALVLGIFAAATQVQAAEWPTAPVRVVVGATPGGTLDTTARLLAEGLTAQLKVPVLVENKAGANGAIAAEVVAQAKSDGQTLLLGTSGLNTLPLLQKSLPYDFNRDLSPVAIVAFTPFLLFSGANSQASSVSTLIAYAKTHPQRLSAGSGDGVTLMASELFKAASGISVISVNYRGGGQMITDIVGGSVDYGFLGATAVMPLAKTGKLRLLGVASAKRLEIAPDVPTLAEQGVKGVFVEPWLGLVLPKGTDQAVVQVLERAIAATVQTEIFQKKISEIGSIPRFMGTDEAAVYIESEARTLEQAASAAGIQPG